MHTFTQAKDLELATGFNSNLISLVTAGVLSLVNIYECQIFIYKMKMLVVSYLFVCFFFFFNLFSANYVHFSERPSLLLGK